MARFDRDQLAFAASKHGYMDRAESIEFLKTMDIRMSVGHWSAGDFCDRFAPPGYHSDDAAFQNTFEGQCRRTKAAGVDAIEIHQSVFETTMNGDLDSEAIERARDGYPRGARADDPRVQHQHVDQPEVPAGRPVQSRPAAPPGRARRNPQGRRDLQGMLKIPVLSVWPGSDGADYHFQIDYRQSLEWFTEALVAVNRQCLEHGIKLAIEPKPYEPRELYMIIPTAASAILVAQAGQPGTAAAATAASRSTTATRRWKGRPPRPRAISPRTPACRCTSSTSTTRGRAGTTRTCMFGTLSIPESVEYLYTTFVRDYRGCYSQDQFTYREDPTRAIERSMINFANLSLKAVRICANQADARHARARPAPGPTCSTSCRPILVG